MGFWIIGLFEAISFARKRRGLSVRQKREVYTSSHPLRSMLGFKPIQPEDEVVLRPFLGAAGLKAVREELEKERRHLLSVRMRVCLVPRVTERAELPNMQPSKP